MPDRRAFALSAATFPLAALVLFLMGREIWCGCGSLVPWAFDVWSRHNSQHVIDPYTLTHVLHGVLFYALLSLSKLAVEWRLAIALVVEAAWEILENTDAVIDRYRTATMSLDYHGDSIVNSLSDLAACGAGFAIAWKISPKLSLALFVIVEAVLLLWVRDSFLLNVIMLVHPIEAIRVWQTP